MEVKTTPHSGGLVGIQSLLQMLLDALINSTEYPLLRIIFPFDLDLPFTLFIQFIMRSYTLIQGLLLASSTWAVEPAAVYNGGYNSAKNVALRIGNGGAGQSGLIEGKPYP